LDTKWECKCDCGTIGIVSSYDIFKGKSTKCNKCNGNAFEDLTNKIFNGWKVIKYDGKLSGHSMWICNCKCGNFVRVCGSSLKDGRSKRCLKCSGNLRSKHGFTSTKNKHPLYNIWISMLARCENPNSTNFHLYGARGIKVCDRWKDCRNFSEDMGLRPFRYTIERIDNNGNYEPSNCRWASYEDQGKNKRNNRILSFEGKTQILGEWAKEWKVKACTLWRYLNCHSMQESYKRYVLKK